MTRPETHCKQLKSSEWASPKANSVVPKAPQPVLVPGRAAGAATDEAQGRLSGQLPLGTPTLGGSSVVRKESDLGGNLRKQRKQVPLYGGDRRESYLARDGPASRSGASSRNSAGSGRSRFGSTAVPVMDTLGSQSRQRAAVRKYRNSLQCAHT